MSTTIQKTPERATVRPETYGMVSPTESNASTSSDPSIFTPPTSHVHSSLSHTHAAERKLGGVDVRDALAKCEDPALGWSMQFWVTIADPLTNNVFFACPATGTCSWEPPVGAFLLPRQANGEWWELADSSRENRSYYYNTMSGETQWDRPTGDAFVIPLGLIQQTALPPRDPETLIRTSASTPAHLSPNKRDLLLPPTTNLDTPTPLRGGPRPPPSPRRHPNANGKQNGGMLATVEELSSNGDSPGTLNRRGGKENGQSPRHDPTMSPPTPAKDSAKVTSMRTKRMSTGLHPLLPTNITAQIQNFQTDEFASRYFATRRTGLLRRQKVPLDRIMEWQRQPISAPLLLLPAAHQKDAVVAFKVIQHVTGERDKPVDGARSNTTRASTVPSAIQPNGNAIGGSAAGSDKMIVLEEIRWLIQLAVSAKEMRDEIYCQLVKQLTKNANHDSIILGLQLFCVLANAFCPSTDFEPLVRTFLTRKAEEAQDSAIAIMANYCLSKIEVTLLQGNRAKLLTIGEIEAASDAAFYPSVYGESLERIMEFQQRSYPDRQVPVILPFLADGILALGGLQTEGIFRIPGDNDSVSELKSRMDRGHYQLQGIDDPHVAASLFKLWLRELESPLIPLDLYDACLSASSTPAAAVEFVNTKLPQLNRRVLVFVISFLQLFLVSDIVEITKMTPSNLALIIAPNLLRSASKSLVTAFTNSSFESKFVLQLLLHLPAVNPHVDPDFVPSHGTR